MVGHDQHHLLLAVKLHRHPSAVSGNSGDGADGIVQGSTEAANKAHPAAHARRARCAWRARHRTTADTVQLSLWAAIRLRTTDDRSLLTAVNMCCDSCQCVLRQRTVPRSSVTPPFLRDPHRIGRSCCKTAHGLRRRRRRACVNVATLRTRYAIRAPFVCGLPHAKRQ